MADVFIFLDDVQFSKGSYTNRVRILANGTSRWLTVPVSAHLGDLIKQVTPAKASWAQSHLDTLRGLYSSAPAFGSSWPRVSAIIGDCPEANIATSNRYMIECIVAELGFRCKFKVSSDFDIGENVADDRLICLTQATSRNGIYLSGAGGANYQDEQKFKAAGLGLRYVEFAHPTYDQDAPVFVPGLSVVDAIFHLGWRGTGELIQNMSPVD